MRKFCLVLCISLLSSMFHAVAMPVATSHAPKSDLAATHEQHHACGEEADASPTPNCQLSGHVCCHGITAATGNMGCTNLKGAELFNPVLQTLVLQDRPNPQFKPPRLFLQS